ncbi:TPA: hypothetical protein ACPSKE_001754 [Legionella feeleii]|uniref:Uncharacterized protein n=1 Tax=Legionella feeleii TaxID=453 RepID=A0A0W0U0F6_9GAMM|nr:hypothetical protein [Legionella feeleii]KTD01416.1 hypothetical protein Lfee_1020 [Legionella feeleii]SPX61224.1 Uncharacterised protein [Legionella feeleii]STX39002.1 Uncharacterised protein [Legionella feeleii]
MSEHYTARIYCGAEEIAHKSGDDIEQLYVWLLAVANGPHGGSHGEIIDNEKQEVVRQFKKRSVE